MFYSETILSKKGPLARVWLAAHWEKKLTKANIVSTDIQSAAKEIREENHAPMALRLSGQLLLGVVRIYSRKARYLLEDCNDALNKIRVVFRPGNVELSTTAVRSNQAQAAHLTLPDMLPDMMPEFDALMPNDNLDLDFDFDAIPSTANVSRRQDITLDRSMEYPRNAGMSMLEVEEDDEEDLLPGGVDLDLDIGLDEEPSVEIGRRAGSEMLEDVGLSFDEGDTTIVKDYEANAAAGDISELPVFEAMETDVNFDGPMDLDMPTDPPAIPHDSVDLDLDDLDLPTIGGVDEQETPRPSRSAPRRRKIIYDNSTELRDSQERKRSREGSDTLETSAIKKKQRFLDSDPVMLSLMNKSLTGGFANDVFAPPNLNPAIRTLLAPEFLHRMAQAQLKRKRTASAEIQENRRELDLDQDLQNPPSELNIGDMTLPPIPEQDFELPELELEDPGEALHVKQDFDEEGGLAQGASRMRDEQQGTQLESQTQLASINTTQAVATIRDRLESDATLSFESLSSGATKAAASELFFQVLLLATKDAIKINQTDAYGNIKIESRPNLFTMTFDSQSQNVGT